MAYQVCSWISKLKRFTSFEGNSLRSFSLKSIAEGS